MTNLYYQLLIGFLTLLVQFYFTEIASASNNFNQCNTLFNIGNTQSTKKITTNPNANESTYAFFNYYISLLEENILQIEDLKSFIQVLEKGVLTNPIPHEKNSLGLFFSKVSFQIHFEAFQDFIESSNINRDALIKLLSEKLNEKTKNQVSRNDTSFETKFFFKTATFYKIEPGSFLMGEKDKTVPVTITQPYEMMDIPVTQMIWAHIQIAAHETDLKKINPSHFANDEDSKTIRLKNIFVPLNPDHPVENISWHDAQNFIDKLNQLSKSDNPTDEKLLKSLFSNHQKGDIYDLPSGAQWEFVLKSRGMTNKKYFDRDDTIELNSYAWNYNNTSQLMHTQVVASLKPRIIEGNSFYDLEGNIWEWTKDWSGDIPGGVDPHGPPDGDYKVVYGGSWYDLPFKLQTGARNWFDPTSAGPGIGLRLIRVLGSQK